ncbi:MAG: roadblock/LC7 domain-containing protein [Candidatus Hodarchaeota archaeon]
MSKKIEIQLHDILKKMLETTAIKSAVIIDKNGLPITSFNKETNKPFDNETEIVAAGLGASILALATRSTDIYKHGTLSKMLIDSENGQMIVKSAGENALILVNLPAGASLGITLLALNQAATEISKLPLSPKQPMKKDVDFSDLKIPTM